MVDAEKYNPITEKVIGCAIEVHKSLKNGFPEIIYHRAFALELSAQKIPHTREQELTVYYKGIEVGKRRVDFLIKEEIIVELKALSEINDSHLAQTLNYLETYNLPIGLILNFGESVLKIKRVINPKFRISSI